jgi:hypothetical protein
LALRGREAQELFRIMERDLELPAIAPVNH